MKTLSKLFCFITLIWSVASSASAAPSISASPLINDLGVVNIGSTSKVHTITVRNNGNNNLLVYKIGLNGQNTADFSIVHDNCSNQTVEPAKICNIDVVLAPVVSGTKMTNMNVPSNDPVTPSVDIPLNGVGSLQQEFSDVPASYWAENYINTLYYNAVTAGCGNGQYCPESPVTRAQMAVFVIRGMLTAGLLPENFTYPSTPYFTDVPATHWAFRFIQKIQELKIAPKCTLTAYCPQVLVTRAQMAVFIIRALYGENFTFSATPYFSDVPASNWAFRYIQKMYEDGITSGCSSTSYCPAGAVTRAQMAVFLTRAFLAFIEHPQIAVSPPSAAFGTINAGDVSAELVFTVGNIGGADLSVSSISITGTDSAEFSIDLNGGSHPCGTDPLIVIPGDSCTVSAVFAPLSEGIKAAAISIVSDDPVYPALDITLNGTATIIPQYNLAVQKNGTGTGTIISTPAGISCGSDCTETYNENVLVLIRAYPDPGSILSGWSGGGCSGTGNCVVTMNGDITVSATFTQQSSGSIDYTTMNLTIDNGYSAMYDFVQIGSYPSKKFYQFTRPSACTNQISIGLADRDVPATVNQTMLVSNRDFDTEANALDIFNYLQPIGTSGFYGYQPTSGPGSGNKYWFKFDDYPGSETIIMRPPFINDYYLMVINEENSSGYFRIQVVCW